MKAVMLGMRYLTNAFGNVIDIVVMKAFEGVLPKQAYEFFLFGGLTLICMVIFGLMARGYKYEYMQSIQIGKILLSGMWIIQTRTMRRKSRQKNQ